ncbi:hypothetical protein [Hydrogenimonas sp.]
MKKVLKTWWKPLAVLAFAASLLLIAGRFGPLVESGYTQKTLLKTTATYAVVRGVNALVSVFKESQINVEPAGIGMTLALGQVLDPLDDLTERISTLLVYSILALGLQELAAEFGGKWLLYLGAAAALLSLAGLFAKAPFARFGNGALKSSLMVAALSLLMPLNLYLNDIFYKTLLLPKIERSQERLERLTAYAKIEKLNDEIYIEQLRNEEEASGLLDSLRSVPDNLFSSYRQMKRSLKELQREFERLKESLDEIVKLLIRIGTLYLAGFLFQVLFLPLATLFLLYRIYRLRVDFY